MQLCSAVKYGKVSRNIKLTSLHLMKAAGAKYDCCKATFIYCLLPLLSRAKIYYTSRSIGSKPCFTWLADKKQSHFMKRLTRFKGCTSEAMSLGTGEPMPVGLVIKY